MYDLWHGHGEENYGGLHEGREREKRSAEKNTGQISTAVHEQTKHWVAENVKEYLNEVVLQTASVKHKPSPLPTDMGTKNLSSMTLLSELSKVFSIEDGLKIPKGMKLATVVARLPNSITTAVYSGFDGVLALYEIKEAEVLWKVALGNFRQGSKKAREGLRH